MFTQGLLVPESRLSNVCTVHGYGVVLQDIDLELCREKLRGKYLCIFSSIYQLDFGTLLCQVANTDLDFFQRDWRHSSERKLVDLVKMAAA